MKKTPTYLPSAFLLLIAMLQIAPAGEVVNLLALVGDNGNPVYLFIRLTVHILIIVVCVYLAAYLIRRRRKS